MDWYEGLLDRGYLPDFMIREGIKYLLSVRAGEQNVPLEVAQARKMDFVKDLKNNPIAIETEKANEQHYEVPTEFIKLCLGKRMKYSCCYFPNGEISLDNAEELMLNLYCDRAKLEDGQKILELGCGWGSLCLFLAERFPSSQITAVSNSKSQKEYIMNVAKSNGLQNLNVITADVNTFETAETFDRILSIEMLEHMKNYLFLFRNISNWLKEDGFFFCHVFSHKSLPYHFESNESNSWMARYFFSGGTMPSHDLFLYFQEHLSVVNHWFMNGMHYAKTSEAWLKKMDERHNACLEALKSQHKEESRIWYRRWRIFYMAVAELFAYRNGEEWGVSHFLFRKNK